MTTPTIQNLTQRQIMLSFAYLAYTGELITTPSPEAQILAAINAAMPQIPPIAAPNDTWQVVWGPAVYTTPGALYQDNLMFVVQNQADTTRFAVAIRGTNFIADIDWLMEDFDVRDMMIWPPGAATSSPAGAMMSESASIGLQVLLGMQGNTAQGPRSLVAFLTSLAQSPVEVCVTGHSLGGCLASTLALYLKEQQSTWDGSGKSIVSAVSFAGPTAGNTAFAAYSDSMFNGSPCPPGWDSSLGTNCDAVRCDLDAAPLVWIAANIAQTTNGKTTSPLFELYQPTIDFSNLTFEQAVAWGVFRDHVLTGVAGLVSAQSYAQIESQATALSGKIQPLNDLDPPVNITSSGDNSFKNYMQAFMEEAGYQHSSSYPIILQVPSLLSSTIIVRGPSPAGSARGARTSRASVTAEARPVAQVPGV